MKRMLAIAGALVSLLILIPGPSLSAATAFAHPAFGVVWQRAESAFPNFWGPLALAHDGQAEQYLEGALPTGQSGQRLVQYFDKARMELTNPSLNPPVVTTGLLTVELKTGKRQLGDNTFEQHQPANINIAGDPGSDSVTYAALGKLPEKAPQMPIADLKPPLAFVNGQFQAVPDFGITGLPALPSVLYGPYVSDPGGRYGQYVFKGFYDFINAIPNGQTVIGYPVSPAIVAQVKIKGVPTWVLLQAFERRVLTFNPLNPKESQVEFGNIGQHYYTWRYVSGA